MRRCACEATFGRHIVAVVVVVVVVGYRLTRRPATVIKFHTCYTSMLCKACYSSGVGGGANNVPLHLQKSSCYGQEGGVGWGWGGIITSLALLSHALPHLRHATLLCVLMHFHTYFMLH